MAQLSFYIILSLYFVILTTFVLPGLSSCAAEISPSLDAKIAATLPTPDEDRWLTISWRTNLMRARLEAQNLNRPMFLWIMNGNPMGCT